MRYRPFFIDYDEFIYVPDGFILGMLFSLAFPKWPIYLVGLILLLVFGGMIAQLGFIASYLILIVVVIMDCAVCIKRCRAKFPVWLKAIFILSAFAAILAMPSVYLLCGGSLYNSLSNVYQVVWTYIGVLLTADTLVYFMLKSRQPIFCFFAIFVMLGAITFLLIGAAWSITFYEEYSRYASEAFQRVFAPIIHHTKSLYNKIDFLGCRAYVNQ